MKKGKRTVDSDLKDMDGIHESSDLGSVTDHAVLDDCPLGPPFNFGTVRRSQSIVRSLLSLSPLYLP